MSTVPKPSSVRPAPRDAKGTKKTVKPASLGSRGAAKPAVVKADKKTAAVVPVQEDLSDLAPSRARMRRLQAGRSVKAEWFEDGYSEELSK